MADLPIITEFKYFPQKNSFVSRQKVKNLGRIFYIMHSEEYSNYNVRNDEMFLFMFRDAIRAVDVIVGCCELCEGVKYELPVPITMNGETVQNCPISPKFILEHADEFPFWYVRGSERDLRIDEDGFTNRRYPWMDISPIFVFHSAYIDFYDLYLCPSSPALRLDKGAFITCMNELEEYHRYDDQYWISRRNETIPAGYCQSEWDLTEQKKKDYLRGCSFLGEVDEYEQYLNDCFPSEVRPHKITSSSTYS